MCWTKRYYAVVVYTLSCILHPKFVSGFLPDNRSSLRNIKTTLHAKKGGPSRVAAENKAAFRNYEIIEEVEAGIQLVGTEVKATRLGTMNIKDGFAQIKDGECWLKNVHVGPHPSTGQYFQHEAKRDRRLLLHKREIRKFNQELSTQNKLTLVPLKAYFNDDNRLKIRLALCRGKDTRDKRDDIKKRDVGRELKRAIKNVGAG